jgi:hypothetical protein
MCVAVAQRGGSAFLLCETARTIQVRDVSDYKVEAAPERGLSDKRARQCWRYGE